MPTGPHEINGLTFCNWLPRFLFLVIWDILPDRAIRKRLTRTRDTVVPFQFNIRVVLYIAHYTYLAKAQIPVECTGLARFNILNTCTSPVFVRENPDADRLIMNRALVFCCVHMLQCAI